MGSYPHPIVPYPIVQVGWSVFEDVEVAAEKWTKFTGAGPFFVSRHIPLEDVVHRGKPTTLDHSTALAQWGTVQLELMYQHCDSPSFIKDLCPDRKSRLVSVSWLAPDLDAETSRMEDLGFPLV